MQNPCVILLKNPNSSLPKGLLGLNLSIIFHFLLRAWFEEVLLDILFAPLIPSIYHLAFEGRDFLVVFPRVECELVDVFISFNFGGIIDHFVIFYVKTTDIANVLVVHGLLQVLYYILLEIPRHWVVEQLLPIYPFLRGLLQHPPYHILHAISDGLSGGEVHRSGLYLL